MSNSLSYPHLLSPLFIGWLFGTACPMNDSSRVTLKSQPPGWVFGVVWPILYLLLGWSWMKTRANSTMNILHVLLILTLNAWVYTAGCKSDYRTGAWIFIPIIGLALTIWMKGVSLHSSGWWIMTPLIAWLLFAHQLNVHIVERS